MSWPQCHVRPPTYVTPSPETLVFFLRLLQIRLFSRKFSERFRRNHRIRSLKIDFILQILGQFLNLKLSLFSLILFKICRSVRFSNVRMDVCWCSCVIFVHRYPIKYMSVSEIFLLNISVFPEDLNNQQHRFSYCCGIWRFRFLVMYCDVNYCNKKLLDHNMGCHV